MKIDDGNWLNSRERNWRNQKCLSITSKICLHQNPSLHGDLDNLFGHVIYEENNIQLCAITSESEILHTIRHLNPIKALVTAHITFNFL